MLTRDNEDCSTRFLTLDEESSLLGTLRRIRVDRAGEQTPAYLQLMRG
jgi:hypothetical protein